MSVPSLRGARLAAAAAGLALVASPLVLAGGAEAAGHAPRPSAAAHGKAGKEPVKLDLLAINDFHGNLEKVDPKLSSSGRINTTPAGGAAYLATHLQELRADAAARGADTITVAAGDIIGASPLLSAAFHDEPTITAMNMMGLQVASVGNHEFDEGYQELLRMQNGGCLDDGADGANNQNSCPDGEVFKGADFQYLSANVKYADTGQTVFPAYTVKDVDGVKVGFIGMTLQDTPNIVTKAGVEGLEFTDEVTTANKVANQLYRQGVKSIVVLLHQGGFTTDTSQYDGCVGVTGPGRDIAEALSPKIDVVVSGHTHQAYNCVVQDPDGKPRLFTSASSFGRLVTDIQLTINPYSRDVVRPLETAHNVIVTNSDGTAADPDVSALVARFTDLVAPIAGKVLGQIAPAATQNSLSKTPDADGGDSPLGNLIAEGQLADPSTIPPGGTAPVVALMNPGGIRGDLVEDGDGNVTYGAAFTVQPFNNYVVSMNLTGQQLLDVLNQQWNGRNEAKTDSTGKVDTSAYKILQVAGLSYTWDRTLAAQTGVDAIVPGSVEVAGAALDPGASYRVVVNSFLSDGGDGFATLAQGEGKYFGGLDIDSLANYLAAQPGGVYTPTPTDRISAVN